MGLKEGSGADKAKFEELQAEPQAYGKIIDGEIALKGGNARQAVKLLTESVALLDK